MQLLKRTWPLAIGFLLTAGVMVSTTTGWLMRSIAGSLVCVADVARSDVLLVENFDPRYVLFERAAALERAGIAPRTLVPVQGAREPGVANPISAGIAEVMAREARLPTWETVVIGEMEPISLNAALQIRDHLRRQNVRSLVIVTSGFRSRRSQLVYRAVLGEAGLRVHCDPVFITATPSDWTRQWHAIQEVAEEFLKLQYYRFYVLPFVARRS
jgi:hypothetical protein